MTRLLLAEFRDQRGFNEAARRMNGSYGHVVEAFTPFPVETLPGMPDPPRSRIRPAMFAGGMIMAALAYGLEYYSAVVNYPYNSGGRPLNAWPTFMLVPFATGILLAAVCGFAVFLFETGLPQLSNPLFGVEGFDGASQDRFLLAVEPEERQDSRAATADLLRSCGAISVREVDR